MCELYRYLHHGDAREKGRQLAQSIRNREERCRLHTQEAEVQHTDGSSGRGGTSDPSEKPQRLKEPLDDLNRLLDKGRIKAEYIKSQEVFAIAKEISSEKEDVRDQISPMDALIVSSAAVDDSCSRFYTTDSRLISNSEVSDIIGEWRDNMGYRPMTIMDVSDIFRQRASRISSFGNLGNRKASRELRRREWRQPAHLQRCEGCLVNGFSDSAPASEH